MFYFEKDANIYKHANVYKIVLISKEFILVSLTFVT